MKEVKAKVEQLRNDGRTPEEMYMYVRNNGVQMFVTNRFSREQVIGICACLIELYEKLKGNGTF